MSNRRPDAAPRQHLHECARQTSVDVMFVSDGRGPLQRKPRDGTGPEPPRARGTGGKRRGQSPREREGEEGEEGEEREKRREERRGERERRREEEGETEGREERERRGRRRATPKGAQKEPEATVINRTHEQKQSIDC